MFNRQFNIKQNYDYSKLIELEHEIMPIVYNSKFECEDEKEKLIKYVRNIFNNQWRVK